MDESGVYRSSGRSEYVGERPAGPVSEAEGLGLVGHAVDGMIARAGQAFGTIERLEAGARQARDAALEESRQRFERSLSLARNRASQRIIQFTLAARDRAQGLAPGPAGAEWGDWKQGGYRTGALEAAEFLRCGSLVMDSASTMSVNSDIVLPFVLPLLNHGNVLIDADDRGESDVAGLIVDLVFRALGATGPGQLVLRAFDPLLKAPLASFAGLRDASEDLLPPVATSESDVDELLDLLTGDVQRVTDLYRGRTITLGQLRQETRQPLERYQLVIIRGFPHGFDAKRTAKLSTLMATGPRAGISFLVHRQVGHGLDDVGALGAGEHTSITIGAASSTTTSAPGFTVRLRPHADLGLIQAELGDAAERVREAAVPAIPLTELLREEPMWQRSSRDNIAAVFGRSGHEPVELVLGDEREQRHNVLISGAVGQGKSNLLMVLIHSLAWRYPPDELAMYLLDLREGMTLFPLAPSTDRAGFLPHAKVIGLQSDREYAAAVLSSLVAEFDRRARTMKPFGDNIARFRRSQPEARMPRIVVVIDEFHVLFERDDAVSAAAVLDLERLARKGRGYGIHLILASQTISGITSLLGKQDGIFAQFSVRVALKNSASESRAVLESQNIEASRLRFRGEAIVNLDFGSVSGNRRAMVAMAEPDALSALRLEMCDARSGGELPETFDGSRPYTLQEAEPRLKRLRKASQADPLLAVLGRRMVVGERLAGIPLTKDAGRHLAVIGGGTSFVVDGDRESGGPSNVAVGMLQGAVIGIAASGTACEFVFVDMVGRVSPDEIGFDEFADILSAGGHTTRVIADQAEAAGFFAEQASLLEGRNGGEMPLIVVGVGLDRVNMRRQNEQFQTPADGLRALLQHGSSLGAHLIGWWSAHHAFSEQIGFDAAEVVGAIVALSIQGRELSDLMGPFVEWEPAPNRALLRDPVQGPNPFVFVPFKPLGADSGETARRLVVAR